MSFSWTDFYVSGFNTGSALSGVQRYTPIYYIVEGLQFNGTPLTTGDFAYFTGKGFSASGTLPNESGIFGYFKKTGDYRGILAFTGASGLYATGCFEFYWNSGATAVATGFTLVKGFELFGNKNQSAWDMLTLADGSKENADSLHTHSAFAQYLYDLDDVFIPGSIEDGNALIYFAASGGWTTGSGSPDDWGVVSGVVASNSGVLAEVSGVVSDYPVVSGVVAEVSGVVADYPVVSGTVSTIDNNYVKTDATRGISGAMEFSGMILIGDIAGGDYFKLRFDDTNLIIESIGGSTILVSGNVSGIDGSKIFGGVFL